MLLYEKSSLVLYRQYLRHILDNLGLHCIALWIDHHELCINVCDIYIIRDPGPLALSPTPVLRPVERIERARAWMCTGTCIAESDVRQQIFVDVESHFAWGLETKINTISRWWSSCSDRTLLNNKRYCIRAPWTKRDTWLAP